MATRADHGEVSYKGSNKLTDKVALITGADSGIGKAVAYAREGMGIIMSYLNEEDARDTTRLIEEAGRKAVSVAGDISEKAHC